MSSQESEPSSVASGDTQRLGRAVGDDPYATPMPDTDAPFDKSELPPDLIWPTLPGYEIVGELGRGGMGVVYKARQLGLNRVVALKMILSGAYAGSGLIRRFKAEAEAVAQLHHPNIVQVYEIGEYRGEGMASAVPYFSLEFVDGGSLDRQLRGRPLPPRHAAQLVETLARAIQAAHDRGIIHRDLKPANVLISDRLLQHEERRNPQSTVPIRPPVVKITDFGLAKQVWSDSGQTRTGDILGTPSYMAPEQAAGSVKGITPATDVYALGAILYELLTGRPPFKAATTAETVLQVLHEEPVPVTQLQASTPRDLQTICAKCLQKDPARRYQTAHALADDLERWQRGEPILARPVGQLERLTRWCRRNPTVASLTGAVALTLVLGLFVTTILLLVAAAAAVRERAAKIEATETNQQLEEQLYANRIAIAERELTLNQDVGYASQLLEQCPERQRGWEWDYLMRLRDGGQPALTGHQSGLWMAAFSPDGKRVATSSIDGTVKIWDVATRKDLFTFRGHVLGLGMPRVPIMCVAWSPDGRSVASGSLYPTLSDIGNPRKAVGQVKIWNPENGKEQLTFSGQVGLVESVAFSPDGKRVASSSINEECTFVVWDAATGKDIHVMRGHDSHVHRLCFSPDGRVLASSSTDGTVILWDAATLEELQRIKAHPAPVFGLAFSPDSQRFATASFDGTVGLWETASGRRQSTLRGHTGMTAGVAFSPDGLRIATGGFDKTVRIWDAATGQERLTLRGHQDSVLCVNFDHTGKQLVSASFDKEARIWDATPLAKTEGPGLFTIAEHRDRVNVVAFQPGGAVLATGSWDNTIRLWDGQTGQAIRTLQGHEACIWGMAFSPDGRRLVTGSWDHTARVWDVATGHELLKFKGHAAPVHCVAFSPLGDRVVSCDWEGLVKVWNPANGELVATFAGHLFPVMCVAISPDGQRVASGSGDRTVKIWNLATGKELLSLRGHEALVHGVAFSPDGMRVASGSWDHTARIWDATTGQVQLTLTGHADRVQSVAFNADGSLLATASEDKTARVWDLTTGKQVGSPQIHRGVVWSVQFSGDGDRLVTGGWAPEEWVRTWRVPAR